ncbi:DnaT-like ssDNA-binding protein [Pseudomonas quasicaspiana]|uniref:DnaT-like ssDNA-binding protein n=1 Tax=Pseudomonas quasicaspiana TaxID=2829821 RepID=UPI001E2E5FAE|nr:DnaT-like ssDNA-binding protein [Pseudomonas quasicaspiana]MCD5970765.1 hypothetical protein [Pseudomonas quasicaspiana]
MIIVEEGKGGADTNSYADLRALQFHGSYYRFPIPEQVSEQLRYLLAACTAMNAMRWKGEKTSHLQAIAWPRRGISIDGFPLCKDHIPYGIRHGQVMLAIEMYAHDRDIELIEPTHAHDGDKVIPLKRSCEMYRLDPPLWTSSRTQFADYLPLRGLKVVK